MIYSIDFETRSAIDLTEQGLDIYANDPTTEVLCIAYGTTPENVHVSHVSKNPLLSKISFVNLLDHVRNGGKIQAWNAMFEFFIWNCVCVPKYGWPPLKLEQCIDSMAIAAANNIPQSLGDAAIFMDAAHKKDTRGRYLINKLCKPKKDGTWDESGVLMAELFNYCSDDVRAEMSIVADLRPLTASEMDIWTLTQRINLRGVPVDPKELRNAVLAVTRAQDALDNECVALTGCKPSERAKLLRWVRDRGLLIDDLTAETVSAKLVDTNLKGTVRRVLELRQEGSQTSTAKYTKMLEMQRAGRIRNTLVYHGSSTGRWSGRGIQPQNLPRPTVEVTEELIGRVLVQGGGGTMSELSSLVRSALVAPEGHTFISYDYSSVENRVGVWLAGQQNKVDLFKQGLDEYRIFSSQVLHNVPYDEVTKEQRQVAKSAVLGSLFGQGPKGLVKYAESMGVKLTEAQAKNAVDGYRSSYAKVKLLWAQCESAAIQAVENPGNPFRVGDKLVLKCAKNALWLRLPSGRLICWQRPQIEEVLTPWNQLKKGITIHSQNTFTRQWSRNQLIGSSIFQSAVQAVARDLLAEAITGLDKYANIMIVMLCHDEILCEVKEEDAESAQVIISDSMSKTPMWAEGLPLACEGWYNKRYQK
jgi:DNA polymerase